MGFSAKLNAATYFAPGVEYGLFLSSYFLLNMVLFMLMYGYREEIYRILATYLVKQVQYSLFWSFIITFFVFCINITVIFAIEGGVCITLLQLYVFLISLTPGLFYPIIAIFFVEKYAEFFKAFNNLICHKSRHLDRLMQVLVLCFLYTLPHILLLVLYLTAVSFFYNPHSTSILILYFSSSSIILWIINAVVIHLISPYLFTCICSSSPLDIEEDIANLSKGDRLITAAQRIVFAVCVGLSLNLINFSVMPFVGDYFYDRRVQGSTVFAIFPIAVTLIGWYVSGDAVNILTKLSLIGNKRKKQRQQKQGSLIELSDLTKPQEPTDVVVNIEAEPEHEKELGGRRKASEYPKIDHFRRAFHILAKQASVISEVDGEPDGKNIESQSRRSSNYK